MVWGDPLLASALAAGLAAVGWRSVRVLAESRLVAAARAAPRLGRLVLVADGRGRLPDPRPALVGHPSPDVVAVGGRRAWPALVEAAERRMLGTAFDADQPIGDLVRALDGRLSGGSPPRDPGALLAALRHREREARLFALLTEREQQVLSALVAGEGAADMAAGWRVSLATVRSHIRAVLAKLGVSSQLGAVALAHRSCREELVVRQIRRAHQF